MQEIIIGTPEIDKNTVKIVRAVPEDAEVICNIRDRAWLKAYPNEELGITDDDIRLIAQGPDGEYLPRRIAYLKEQFAQHVDSNLGTYVAKVDGKVVGYTDPHIDERGHRRIGAMYVAPEAQGNGVGGKLMSQALDALGRDEDIYLEVVSYNDNAISFYEHFGFKKTDAPVPEDVGRPTYLKTLPQKEMVLRAA